MLAATVALSPVITTSVVFQPTNVEAATVSQEIDVLAERFFGFYKHAGSYGFTGTPTVAINGLTYAQIQSTATANGITLNVPVAKQADFENLMKNTAKLIYTQYATAADLAEAVKSFKTANSGYFNSLFDEDGNVFADQLILFVKDLESQLELAIMDAKTPTFAAIISAAVRNTFANGANKAQYANIDGKLGNVGLSVEGLFLLQEKLNDNFVDTNKNLRSAMLQSAFQEKGAYIERSNNQFTLFVPIKFINDFINVPLRGSIHWQTSNPSVATFSGNTLTAVSTGTVNVYATIDGLKLATFGNVSVAVTPPVIPGPGDPPPPKEEPRNPPHIEDATVIIKGEPSPETGQVDVVTKVKPEKIEEIIANEITGTDNTIPIILQVPKANEVVKAQIPVSLFTKAGENAIVEIKTDDASYRLPASEINAINTTELNTKLGVPAGEEFEIVVSVNVKENVGFQNGIKVVSKVVEFVVEAVYKDKREPLENFTGYVERTIVGEEDFDPSKAVGVKVNSDGSVTPVPTTFAGKTATFNSLTNSLYTVVQNEITFTDLTKPWHEKKYIETLANKLIIEGKKDSQGKPDGTFAPGEDMTRAQFTTMLVKALALPSKKDGKVLAFSDVKESDWFKDALDIAVGYGIITGKPDGRFAPNEPVTRSQVAIMLHRTMELGFINDMTKVNPDKKEFTDVAKLDAKTKEAIDALYEAGIISGKPDGTFDPNGKTLRNHMAKMLAEFLISAKLMNKIK
jgi:hypothetical protein